MPRVPKKIAAEQWLAEIRKRGPLTAEDERLIEALSSNILERWRERALMTDDPAEDFRERRTMNQAKAIGAIVAMLELARAVGNGSQTPPEWQGLFQ